MKKYLITSEAFRGYIFLIYSDMLIGVEINAKLERNQHEFILKNAPIYHKYIDKFKQLITRNGTTKMIEYKEDLTFDHFWDAYDHKMSNKKRAANTWKKMNNKERRKALFYIARYERYLKTVSHAKLGADSYLTQQRWNN